MKKIISLVLFAALAAAMGTGTNSCAPTEANQSSVDTTRLVSSPSSLALTWDNASKVDSSSSTTVKLTCGCPFVYYVTAYGGDTSVIHFNVSDSAQSFTSHSVSATIFPSLLPAGPDTTTAWVILLTWDQRTVDNPGTPLYDTILATATY